MFTATVLAIFLVPFFFVAISGGLRKEKPEPKGVAAPEPAS
jgi:hypothetical protein